MCSQSQSLVHCKVVLKTVLSLQLEVTEHIITQRTLILYCLFKKRFLFTVYVQVNFFMKIWQMCTVLYPGARSQEMKGPSDTINFSQLQIYYFRKKN